MKLGLVMLLWATCALGQSLIPSYEPERLADQLKNVYENEWNCKDSAEKCDSAAQDDLLRRELHTSSELKYCSEVARKHVMLDGTHDAGFVQLQCGWNLNLVFTQKMENGWQFLQTIVVPNHSEGAEVSLASVTGDDSQQVLVHHAQYAGGTGISRYNFIVFYLDHGELRQVLNEVESGEVMAPWTEHEASQESRFVFEPSMHRTSGPKTAPAFTETQLLWFSGRKVELKREYSWSEKEHVFIASQWFSARMLPRAQKNTKGTTN